MAQSGVEHGKDVRVFQPGGYADLAQESLGAERGRQLRPHDLEGDRAIVLEVTGEVDRSHAATPEFALNHIAAPKGISQRRINCGHENARWGDYWKRDDKVSMNISKVRRVRQASQ